LASISNSSTDIEAQDNYLRGRWKSVLWFISYYVVNLIVLKCWIATHVALRKLNDWVTKW